MGKLAAVGKDISMCFHLAMATRTLGALCREKVLSELPNGSMIKNDLSYPGLRGFFTNHPDRSIYFWNCPSKAQWSLHFLAHEDATSTKIAAGCHPATLLDTLQSKSAATCLDAWRTFFARPSSQGFHFLPLKGNIKNLLQPSYAKGEGWLLFIGKSVTLCARATRAILNYASIGEFRQHFFPIEYTQCLCGHCLVETHRYIFANCHWFAHFPLTDLVPTVKDFVKFLKEHPSAFTFPSQDRLSSEPPEPP